MCVLTVIYRRFFSTFMCVYLKLMFYEKDFCLFFQVWIQTSFAKANQMVPIVTL